MKRILFLAALLAVTSPVLCQTLPSAASQATIKGINLPVNKYNGTASVSVPLYRAPLLNGGSIPVGLSYTTSGIKVNEKSGPAGLGWQLIAGGKITRIVLGLPDETSTYNTERSKLNLSRVHYGYQDTEKDVFYFEYPGGGGRFIFGDGFFENTCNPSECTLTGNTIAELEAYNLCMRTSMNACTSGGEVVFSEIHTLPGSDLKVDFHYTDKLTSYFVITDTYGNKYTFGNGPGSESEDDAFEVTLSEKSQLNQSAMDPAQRVQYISTWHLTKIDYAGLSDDDNTKFSYSDEYSTEVIEEGTETQFNAIDYTAPNFIQIVDQHSQNTQTTTEVRRLSSIKTSKAKVTFSYAHWMGEDAAKLNFITLFDKDDNEVSRTELNFYTNKADGSYNYDNIYGSESANSHFRLMLNSVTKDGLKLREFTYKNEGNNVYYQLPPRGSYYTDHWGYYNGGSHHEDVYVPFPTLEEEEVTDQGSATFKLIGMNKNSYHSARANILTRVYYPSGGYTTFDYGIHPNGGGVRVKNIRSYNEYGVKVGGSTYEYFDNDPENFIKGSIPRYLKFVEISEYDINGNSIIESWESDRYKFNISPSAESLIYDLNGSSIGYKSVKVINELTDSYTIHYFKTEFDDEVDPVKNQYYVDMSSGIAMEELPSQTNQSPYSSTDLKFFDRGVEEKVEVFDEGGTLINSVEYNYEHTSTPFVYDSKAMKVEFLKNNPTNPFFPGLTGTKFVLLASEYDIEVKNLQLISTISTHKDNNGQVTEVKEFSYDGNYQTLPVQVSTGSSTGHYTQKFIDYPFSNLSEVEGKFEDPTVLTDMVDNNQIGIPVQEINYIKYPHPTEGYKVSGARLTTFKDFYGQILPHLSYSLAMNEPGEYNPGNYVLATTNDYHENGQLKSQEGRSGIKQLYNYDGNGNLSSQVVDNQAGETQATTYAYEPLVGVSSVTGPGGRSASYEYDGLNRLSLIRDQDDNIVKRYRYNYGSDADDFINEMIADLDISHPRLKNVGVTFSAQMIQMRGEGDFQWTVDGIVSDGLTRNHVFSSGGTYDYTFSIENPEYENVKEYINTVTIYDDYWRLNPISGASQTCTYPDNAIDYSHDMDIEELGYSISFAVGAFDCAGGGPLEYSWYYDAGSGDVPMGTGQEATLPVDDNDIRAAAGTVTIKVIASDNCGLTQEITKTLTVSAWDSSCGGQSGGGDGDGGDDDNGGGPSNPWSVSIIGNAQQSICPNTNEPSSVTLTSQITEGDHDCGTVSYTYTWEYEVNGQTYSLGGGSSKTITRSALLANGSTGDTYSIILTVSDGCGETFSNSTDLTFKLNC